VLNVEDTEEGFVRGGMEGRVVEVGEGVPPPLRPALRFCVLLVLPRPKPWRLKDDMMISGASLAGRGSKAAVSAWGPQRHTGKGRQEVLHLHTLEKSGHSVWGRVRQGEHRQKQTGSRSSA